MIIGVNGWDKDSELFKKALKFQDYNIRVIHYNTKGKAETLKKMIKDAKYNLVNVLDADDLFLPTKLEKQIDFIKKSNYDVVGCAYERLETVISVSIMLGKLKI